MASSLLAAGAAPGGDAPTKTAWLLGPGSSGRPAIGGALGLAQLGPRLGEPEMGPTDRIRLLPATRLRGRLLDRTGGAGAPTLPQLQPLPPTPGGQPGNAGLSLARSARPPCWMCPVGELEAQKRRQTPVAANGYANSLAGNSARPGGCVSRSRETAFDGINDRRRLPAFLTAKWNAGRPNLLGYDQQHHEDRKYGRLAREGYRFRTPSPQRPGAGVRVPPAW